MLPVEQMGFQGLCCTLLMVGTLSWIHCWGPWCALRCALGSQALTEVHSPPWLRKLLGQGLEPGERGFTCKPAVQTTVPRQRQKSDRTTSSSGNAHSGNEQVSELNKISDRRSMTQWCLPAILALGRLKQEFKARLGSTVRPCVEAWGKKGMAAADLLGSLVVTVLRAGPLQVADVHFQRCFVSTAVWI